MARRLGSLATRAARGGPRRVARALGYRPRPMLSVVVPVYNVEHWVGAALDSILGQSFRDLEVIVVDDGSPDGSIDVVRRIAARDPRIRIVRKQNAGLGAARNTGLEHVRGTYVAFADSDDLVMPGTYDAMVGLLERTGSDFVTGAFERGEEETATRPRWVRRLTRRTRTGLRIEDEPWALLDITSWNKVFRRSFIEEHGLRFDEGVRYEDQVPITRAYLSATFDILDKTVYLWRTRHDGTSITQQKSTLADLSDRLRSQEGCARLVRDAPQEIRETWFVKLLDYDLPSYVQAALSGNAEYADAVRARLAALRAEIPEDLWARIQFRNRVTSWALSHGELDVALALRVWFQRHRQGLPIAVRDGVPVFELPADVVGDALPDSLHRVEQVDVVPQVHLLSVAWEGDELVLRGSAYLLHVTGDYAPHELSLHLRVEGRDVEIEVPVTRYADERLDDVAQRAFEDRTGSGFEARIDAQKLAEVVPAGQQELVLDFHHTQGAFAQDSDLTSVLGMGPGGVRDGRVVADRLVRLTGNTQIGHRLAVHDHWALTAGQRVVDGRVELTVAGPLRDPIRRLTRGSQTGRDETAGTVTVQIEPEKPDFLDAVLQSGRRLPVLWNEEPNILGGPYGGFVRRGPGQRVRCGNLRPAVSVTGVEVIPEDPSHLLLHGTSLGAEGLRLRLMSPRAGAVPSEKLPNGDFTLRLPVVREAWSLGETALPAGRYSLALARSRKKPRPIDDSTVEVATSLRSTGPYDVEIGGQPLRIGVTGAWNLLVVSSPLGPGTGSARTQRRLRDEYAAARTRPRLPVALIETFKGRMAGDSPAAIARELLLRRAAGADGVPEPVFSVHDLSVAVPPGVRKVVRFSPEWYDLLGRASYIVNNDNFPWFFSKAEGQVYVQTWHGTPLKRIAKDIDDPQLIPVAYMKTMDAEAATWDYLVSPSPYCSEILPGAFGYDGPLLELGYPRNDALLTADADRVRAEVRAKLGIKDGRRVVLYAPTWRDVDAKVLYLDPAKLVEEVPDTVLLVRGHVNTSDSDAIGPAARGRIRDVTLYPDINDLFLASDVLVTDYSSVMFDFALLDRPQVFLVPDLDEYRGDVRGFYLDLEEIAPGPICRDDDALIAHLRAGEAADEPYREARARFRERFAPWDDGLATKRVVDAMLGGGPTSLVRDTGTIDA
ncbi:bifunctional glycosyltransferase family 2 protein/CDP-glycerol:glycerophosphate glycerophosphotransferase [Nocardioides sp. KR10-350]|uniref:bifunctional glycosyltransferase/CDP-glycerol:glycerophosphate glycerophosphotransferase n=1 Tax=Nocardioides cheoyonin TaxID=3156615 RepID=UPI0032B54DFD